jgi:iron(III) transport system ATP-binding protein
MKVSLKNIAFNYDKNHRLFEALSLEVANGEIVAIIGDSGSGKSTILRLISGLELPKDGEIKIGDKLVCNKDFCILAEKRQVGMVFQDYALFPHMSVEDNVGYGVLKKDQAQKSKLVDDALKLVNLQTLKARFPHQLSGGQQQRVALARTLVSKPKVLLLDEPFSNLDKSLKQQIRSDLKDILQKTKLTTIFVTHDQDDAKQIASKIYKLEDGLLTRFKKKR